MKNITYILTPELRNELKRPLGLLISGSNEEVINKLGKIMKSIKPKKIISVGDVISKSMLEKRFPLNIFIVDNKSMRKVMEPLSFKADKTLKLVNPAGTITEESWRIIGEAINSKGLVRVLVDGEEDLLTIVAVLLAPENSMVVYGQPNKGVVVINVNKEIKRKMHDIISRMKYKPEKLK